MLEFRKICYNVNDNGNNFEILKDINLKLEDNKLYVITGPNGGGKTSLAKIIMGMYKPTSGNLIFNGKDITNVGITERARMGIGYAFQHPPRFKGIKVKELLDMAAGSHKSADICELLHDVGLCPKDYVNREIDSSLSGGELKRIEIATILARKDIKVAVFDEPEAGIDLWSFQKLGETFKNIHEKYDTTIVIISHQERILKLADEVLIVSKGKLIEGVSKQKIFSQIIRNDSCKYSVECKKGVGKNVEHIG